MRDFRPENRRKSRRAAHVVLRAGFSHVTSGVQFDNEVTLVAAREMFDPRARRRDVCV
jgi:hypothetical protein